MSLRVRVAALVVGCLTLEGHGTAIGARESNRPAFDRAPLVLLADRDYPPLSYLDEAGKPTGLDVDLAHALAPLLKREVRVELMDWAAAQQEVLSGRADGLLSMSITHDREVLYDFTQPTVTHDFGVFVRGRSADISSLRDLAGRSVGVTPGGLPRGLLETQTTARLVPIANYAEGFERLSAGALDAVAADQWVAAYTLERARATDIVSAGQPFARLSGAIAVRKGDASLAEIDQAVRAAADSGTLLAIQERWRPKQMVFVSRERLGRILMTASAGVVTLLLGGTALWVNTRRKQMHARRLLAHALQSANDCICITGTDDHILYVNDAFLRTYEYSEGELLGRHIGIVRSPDNGPDVAGRVLETAKRDGWRGTIRNRSKSGRDFPVSLSTSMVRDEHGRVIATVGVARDITSDQAAEDALRQTEAQLRQAQKMEAIGQLAGGIAHDFNNLLTAILGYAELLHERLAPSEAWHGDLEEIQRAARSAASLTRQLLIFSRKSVIEPVVLDLNEIVGRLDGILKRIVGEHIEFVVRPSETPLRVRADAGQVEQVILNLVVNARDAMPTGGRLLITTDLVQLDEALARTHQIVPAGAFVRLTVADTGAGMTPEVQAQIFTPFFTTKEPTAGTGLGLATVHGIVQQAGGCIVVDSAPARGATFMIYLPQTNESVELAAHTDAVETVMASSGTILFVEDDESIRALGGRALRRYGFRVLTARHAAEAFELAVNYQGRIDLLITDVVMPGLHGPALAERLRQSRADLCVLYTSGYSDNVLAFRDAHATDAAWLQKPYTPASLARRVRDVLGG